MWLLFCWRDLGGWCLPARLLGFGSWLGSLPPKPLPWTVFPQAAGGPNTQRYPVAPPFLPKNARSLPQGGSVRDDGQEDFGEAGALSSCPAGEKQRRVFGRKRRSFAFEDLCPNLAAVKMASGNALGRCWECVAVAGFVQGT